jgi:hypothetical protein
VIQAKCGMVGSVLIEQFCQEWAVHVPVVFVNKSCVLGCVKIAKEVNKNCNVV